MSRISAGYVRQILLRVLLLTALTAGMLLYSVVRSRWGLSTSTRDVATEASKWAPTVTAMLAASYGFISAFVLAPCIALAVARGRKLWLLSSSEARRFEPEQVMPLRISGSTPESGFDFGAIYSEAPLDGPWLKGIFRNTALLVLPLPFAPFVLGIGSAQALAYWAVGTGVLCLALLGLWYEAGKIPKPVRSSRSRLSGARPT